MSLEPSRTYVARVLCSCSRRLSVMSSLHDSRFAFSFFDGHHRIPFRRSSTNNVSLIHFLQQRKHRQLLPSITLLSPHIHIHIQGSPYTIMAKDIPNQPSIGGPPIVPFPAVSATFQSTAAPTHLTSPVSLVGLDSSSTDPVLQWSSSTRRFPFSFPTTIDVRPHVRNDNRNPFVPNLSGTARTFPVDYSDNESQVKILQHHYLTELSVDHNNQYGKNKDWKQEELLKDYTDDTVIYQVVDGVPATYRGKRGIRRMLLQHDDCHISDPTHSNGSSHGNAMVVDHVELEHVAVNHNHAQVVWKGQDSQSRTRIVGTDSFTFDHDNHIVKQTVVAMTSQCNNDNHYGSDFF
jgi:hypothetical protein